MKNTLQIIVALSVTSLVIAACKKNPSYSNYGTPSLNQLFSDLKTTPQGISVTAGKDTIVYGASGTMLHFYANSFKDANGKILTGGTVNIQLVEMYKPGDMICNRATTMANGQILQSGGQINIAATMNGQTVYANKYGIGFKLGHSSSNPMALFYGNTGSSDSMTTWTQSDTTKPGTKANSTREDSVKSPYGYSNPHSYVFDSSINFSWANCDWFYANDSPKTSVSVVLPDTSFNASNTQLFIALPIIRAGDTLTAVLSNAQDYRLGGSNYNTATKTLALISEGATNIVPAGNKYNLVVITKKNGNYYYYEQSGIIPHNGIVATAAMATDTRDDIKARLSGL